MRLKEIKAEIHRIANLNDSQKALEEIKEWDKQVSKPKVGARKRGNYYYFYEVEIYYNPEVKAKRERVIGKLGRIQIDDYEKNKDKIKKMGKEELIGFLEQY